MIRSGARARKSGTIWSERLRYFLQEEFLRYQRNCRACSNLTCTNCVGDPCVRELEGADHALHPLPISSRTEPTVHLGCPKLREEPNEISTVAGSRSHPSH